MIQEMSLIRPFVCSEEPIRTKTIYILKKHENSPLTQEFEYQFTSFVSRVQNMVFTSFKNEFYQFSITPNNKGEGIHSKIHLICVSAILLFRGDNQ